MAGARFLIPAVRGTATGTITMAAADMIPRGVTGTTTTAPEDIRAADTAVKLSRR